MPKWWGVGLVAVAMTACLLALGVGRLVRASQIRPDHLGWHDGGFAPCPDMPNCVSSLADDPRHGIEPLVLDMPMGEAMDRLDAIVADISNGTIITRTDRYLHAEIHSPGLGYVDDLELYCNEQAGVIHVKSSARVPYYDFQVNRERVEALRATWKESD